MSKVSDVLIEISEYLDTDLSDEKIAEQLGCPVSWVTQEREEQLRYEAGVYYEEKMKFQIG